MANWLTRRSSFWTRAFNSKVRGGLGILITVLTVVLALRDSLVDPKDRETFLGSIIPPLPWYWWLVIGTMLLMVLALEGAYGVSQNEVLGFQRRYRNKIKEMRREHLGELTSVRVAAVRETQLGLSTRNGQSALESASADPRPAAPNTPNASLPTPSQVTPRAIEQDKHGRIILDLTPEYLVGLYAEHTVVQADKIVEVYIGKWLRVSGNVKNVSKYSNSAMVLMITNGAITAADFTAQRWTDHALTLRMNTEIRVLGKLSRVDQAAVYLTECEITD